MLFLQALDRGAQHHLRLTSRDNLNQARVRSHSGFGVSSPALAGVRPHSFGDAVGVATPPATSTPGAVARLFQARNGQDAKLGSGRSPAAAAGSGINNNNNGSRQGLQVVEQRPATAAASSSSSAAPAPNGSPAGANAAASLRRGDSPYPHPPKSASPRTKLAIARRQRAARRAAAANNNNNGAGGNNGSRSSSRPGLAQVRDRLRKSLDSLQ